MTRAEGAFVEFSCAVCGYTERPGYADPQPASITVPHNDPRDGLSCLRATLDNMTGHES